MTFFGHFIHIVLYFTLVYLISLETLASGLQFTGSAGLSKAQDRPAKGFVGLTCNLLSAPVFS